MGRGSAGQGDLPGATGEGRKPTIAVFNSSEDTVDLLRTALESEGFQTVVGHIPDVKKGEIDLIDFVNHHTPAVIVYDISPPYAANCRYLRLVRSSEPLKARQPVITTTDEPQLERPVGESHGQEDQDDPSRLEDLADGGPEPGAGEPERPGAEVVGADRREPRQRRDERRLHEMSSRA